MFQFNAHTQTSMVTQSKIECTVKATSKLLKHIDMCQRSNTY